jgi:magnesium-transporting ATPase (P-type)
MTGEPLAISKNATKDPLLLSGCNIEEGTGRMIALAVGVHSQWGKTLKSLTTAVPAKTPLELRLESLALLIGRTGVTFATITFLVLTIGWLIGDCKKNLFTLLVAKASSYIFTLSEVNKIVGFIVTAITLIVVAIPEGLPLVMIFFIDL